MQYRKIMKSPIGRLTLIASEKKLQFIAFEHEENKYNDVEIKKDHAILVQCEQELKEYFQGMRKKFTVPMELQGTAFQKKVWAALTKVPYGKTRSYGEQAQSIGNKKGVRAVGAANGRNPIPIIIPCHRVIASTGHLHGFGGGLSAKQKLLEIEGLEIKNQRMSVSSR